MHAFKLHDAGPEVQRLQLLLNSRLNPSPRLKVDGRFGPATHQALVAFQTAHHLVPDGRYGPSTRAALGQKAVASTVPAPLTPGAPWMDIAVAELGVHEDALPGQHNQRIVEYHATTLLAATDDETPWCSSFVNWVMQQAGFRGTRSAAAKSWLGWGIAATPVGLGAVTVIKKLTPGITQATGSSSGYHVGFFISQTSTHIRLLGGNQGDQVKYSNFALASYAVQGHRRPA